MMSTCACALMVAVVEKDQRHQVLLGDGVLPVSKESIEMTIPSVIKGHTCAHHRMQIHARARFCLSIDVRFGLTEGKYSRVCV